MLPERTVDRFRRSLEKRRDWLELELSPPQIRPLSRVPRLWYFIGDSIDWLAAHAQLTGVGRVSTELFFAAESAPEIHLYPCVLRSGTLRSASANELLTLSQRTGRIADSAGPDEGVEELRAGDHVFFTGLAWTVPFVEAFKGLAARGIDFSVLIHDIIPIERPELVSDEQARSFSDWLVTVVNTANVIFVSSRRVESQIVRWAVLSGLEIKALIVTIQFGLRHLGNTVLPAKKINEQTDKINLGKFVLSVGTIDARKNQILLCRVWHALIDRLGADRVPQLILVGRDDLGIASIDASYSSLFANNKIAVLEDISDLALAELYQSCLFTAFSSLSEGYGLPVAESLQYGKLCLASDLAAIREHASDLVWYFDPTDPESAFKLFLRAVENDAEREKAEAHISEAFRASNWIDTLRTMAIVAERTLREPISPFQSGAHLPKFPGAPPTNMVQALGKAERWCVSDRPEVSILIVNWDSASLTRECIRQIWGNTDEAKYEIVVVDNGSSQHDLDGLRHLGDGVRLITLGCNRFFGEANNIAAEAARGRYLCFLNNDAFVQPGWMRPLIDPLAADPANGATGPLFLFPDGRVQEAGAVVDAGGYPVRLGRDHAAPTADLLNKKTVDYISGAALVVPRNLFMEVGGFDLAYEPAYYEDTDLCLKIGALGRKILYCPQSRVVHIEGSAANDNLEAEVRRKALGDLNRGKFTARWQSYLTTRNVKELEHLRSSLGIPRAVTRVPDLKSRTAVVYTPNALTPGGGERYLLTAASVLAEHYMVTMVTPHPYSSLRLWQLGQQFQLDLSEVGLKTEEFLDESPPDIMLTMGNHIIPPIAGRGRVNLFHCQFPCGMASEPNSEDRTRLSNYDAIVVNSQYTSAHVYAALSAFQLPKIDVRVVYPPVQVVRAGDNNKKPKILTVGRFFVGGHAKRQDALIDAFKSMCVKFDGDVELHLAGSVHPEKEHQDYLASLRASAENYPIRFHVNCSAGQLNELYQEASIYWHGTGIGADLSESPEKAEHFGISIVEAMLAGAIPFALNSGGPREIIENGVTGFLYDSIDALKELTIETLAAGGCERVERMRRAARLRASHFSGERFRLKVSGLADEFNCSAEI
jgi:GT2 family glycosyltransferase/glycosyltransferase involved in cell wall biosynthesis